MWVQVAYQNKNGSKKRGYVSMLDDLKKLNKKQLRSKLKDSQEILQNFRFQKVLQQLENPFQIRKAKKDIARIKTMLREIELDIRKAAK